MCDPDHTYGFTFTPRQPPAAAKTTLAVIPGKPGCYSYKAAPGDYPEALASKFEVKLQQLLLDNAAVLPDPSTVPSGVSLVVCGVSSTALASARVVAGDLTSTAVPPAPAQMSRPVVEEATPQPPAEVPSVGLACNPDAAPAAPARLHIESELFDPSKNMTRVTMAFDNPTSSSTGCITAYVVSVMDSHGRALGGKVVLVSPTTNPIRYTSWMQPKEPYKIS
jgi:hypothetical protein